ncbi:MAG: SidA/IucD/PvdA family monooxygenase, partial [Trebonia sp.]
FSEEGYFPQFTRYYYGASREGKRALDRYMRPTNYSSADADVLDELYMLMYEQRLDDRQRVFVRGNRVVTGVEVPGAGGVHGVGGVHAGGGNVKLTIAETITGETEHDEVDFVVLATGFRDLGPGEDQEAYPALLSGVIDQFAFDEDGYLAVAEDYGLRGVTPDAPPLFLNGLCESSHGIGDAGSFSLLSLRAATIVDGYRRRMDAPDLTQAEGLNIRKLEASKA